MSEIVIIQDTAEPNPNIDARGALFSPKEYVCAARGRPGYLRDIAMRRESLETGDYSLPGLEHVVTVERKTLSDLLGTLYGVGENSTGDAAPERDRFMEECCRMGAMIKNGGRALIVVEASERDARHERYRSRVSAQSLLKDLDAIYVDFGVPVFWAGDRLGAERAVGDMLGRLWKLHTDPRKAREAVRRGRDVFMPWLCAGARKQVA